MLSIGATGCFSEISAVSSIPPRCSGRSTGVRASLPRRAAAVVPAGVPKTATLPSTSAARAGTPGERPADRGRRHLLGRLARRRRADPCASPAGGRGCSREPEANFRPRTTRTPGCRSSWRGLDASLYDGAPAVGRCCQLLDHRRAGSVLATWSSSPLERDRLVELRRVARDAGSPRRSPVRPRVATAATAADASLRRWPRSFFTPRRERKESRAAASERGTTVSVRSTGAATSEAVGTRPPARVRPSCPRRGLRDRAVDLEDLGVLAVDVDAVGAGEVPDVLGVGVAAVLLRGVAGERGRLALEVAPVERRCRPGRRSRGCSRGSRSRGSSCA